jgi:hypothetical protein
MRGCVSRKQLDLDTLVCTRGPNFPLSRLESRLMWSLLHADPGSVSRFSYDCHWRAEARSKKGKSACGVYLPDLEHKRPPDLPPGMVKLRLVKGD